MLDKELAGLVDALSKHVETSTRDGMRVELRHGLFDVLVIVAVLVGDGVHAELFHQLVDRELLGIRVDSRLVDDRVDNGLAVVLVAVLVSIVEALEEVTDVVVIDLSVYRKENLASAMKQPSTFKRGGETKTSP